MVLIFGDTHGNFRHVQKVVEAERPAAIIFLGDMDAEQPLEKELAQVMKLTDVWWIPGNHDVDTMEKYENVFNSELADKNLHGRVVEIDGHRIAGLGGVFRETVWYPRFDFDATSKHDSYQAFVDSELAAAKWQKIRKDKALGLDSANSSQAKLDGKALLHKSTIFYDVWETLYCEKADILVTHEAPSCHPNGFVGIDVLAQSLQIKSSFHGHHHDCRDYKEYDFRLGFKANGVGLCGVSDLSGNVVLAGLKDEKRKGYLS